MQRHNIFLEWQNYQSALICSVLTNINRDPRKSKVYTPQDFMPSRRAEKRKQSPEEMLEIVKTWDNYLSK